MKKILFLASFLFLGFTNLSHAQLQEGNIMLGADIGSGLAETTSQGLFGFNLGLDENSGYQIGVSPKMGYFLSDDFVVGAIVNLGYTNEEGEDEFTSNEFVYGLQAFSRFYLTPAELDLSDSVPAGQFFIETNAGLAGVNVEGAGSTNGFAFGFGPGYSLFLNDNIALDASVKYNGISGAGGDGFQQSLGINLGIQVFLSRSSAEETINQF